MSWKWIRRISQIAFLIAFVDLLLLTRWQGAGAAPPPNAWFLQMDPLAALLSWLSPMKPAVEVFVPAVVALVLTVVLGRVFCGWVCPMGTVIDAADKLLWSGKRRRMPQANRPALKYYLLGAALVAALFGTQLGWLADPIPLLTRTFATVLYPAGQYLYNVGVVEGRPALVAMGWRLYPIETHPFALTTLTMGVFVGIIALSALSRRYWCRTLCPLGALLAFVGRFGLLRRRVSDSCLECRKCHSECKMGAIPDQDYSATRAPECIQCFDCVTCPKPGISRIGFEVAREKYDPATGASRRHFVAACGLGALYAVAAASGVARKPLNSKLLRPPGAIVRDPVSGIRRMTEEEFRDLCLRCGACMKACPTGGLQPAVVEAGFDGLFTPILVPKVGWCEQNCNACGVVCPSGAISSFAIEEKPDIPLGLATIDTSKCLAWGKGRYYKQCLVCDEQCSYRAVETRKYEGKLRPFVNQEKCVGCGICENKCPVRPDSAIVAHRRVQAI